MSDRDRDVYSKATRRKLDALEARKRRLSDQVREVDRAIEELICGQSPIVPGDRIIWFSGSRTRHGRVVAVRSTYRGQFEYRVEVTTQAGRVIGTATVGEQDQPQLETA